MNFPTGVNATIRRKTCDINVIVSILGPSLWPGFGWGDFKHIFIFTIYARAKVQSRFKDWGPTFHRDGVACVLVQLHGTDLESPLLINSLLAWLGFPKHCVNFPQSCLGWVGWGIQLAALSLQVAWLKDKKIGFIAYYFFFLSNYTRIAKLLSKSGKRGSEMDLNFLLGVWELRWDVNCDSCNSDGNCNTFLWVGAVSRYSDIYLYLDTQLIQRGFFCGSSCSKSYGFLCACLPPT